MKKLSALNHAAKIRFAILLIDIILIMRSGYMCIKISTFIE